MGQGSSVSLLHRWVEIGDHFGVLFRFGKCDCSLETIIPVLGFLTYSMSQHF
ncbi:hypothetical protein BDZ97DRAFT_1858260 [Flammula alnicola]|nr:hypothetical protein BDZ97DRAFT_1858260 [Flammula alnicola]